MRSLATLGALLSGASLAQAGPADDCKQVRDLTRQLRGCTYYIWRGKVALENLATAQHLGSAPQVPLNVTPPRLREFPVQPLVRPPTTILAVHDGPPGRGARGVQVGMGVINRWCQSWTIGGAYAVGGRWRAGVAVRRSSIVPIYRRCDVAGQGSKAVNVWASCDVTGHHGRRTITICARRHVTERGSHPVAVYARRRVTAGTRRARSSP